MTDISEHRRNEKRRLIWLSVNSSYSHSSLALPLLHAACRKIPGWEWIPLETTVADDPSEVAAHLNALQGCLLCTTLYLFNRNTVTEILERFHALNPACHIAVGGPECLGGGAEHLIARYPFIHTVFRGESEGLFPDFLNRFPSQGTTQIIPEKGNAVYEKWEAAPPPAEDDFFRTDKPFVQMETSRGCPMGCLYCTSGRTKLRFKSPDAVAEELAALHRRGIREVRLLDRTFNYPQERGIELLRLFRNNFPEMRFHLEIHPQFLNAGLRKELEAALPGQLHIEAGIQCLAGSVQNAIGRRSRPEDALDGLRFLCSCPNFETHADLLAGLPEQSPDHLFHDVSCLMEAGTAEIQLEVLKVLPGTPLRAQAGSLGLIFAPEPPYDVMQTNTMSTEDILLARKLSRLLDLTYNHPALRPVLRTIHAERPDFLPDFLQFFLSNGLDLKRLYDLKKRFLLLLDFLSGGNYKTAAEELAFQWIRSGYPPESGPGMTAVKTGKPPETAVLLEGDPASAKERETKYWLLPGRKATFYFAFHRKYAINRPAAVWKQEVTTPFAE